MGRFNRVKKERLKKIAEREYNSEHSDSVLNEYLSDMTKFFEENPNFKLDDCSNEEFEAFKEVNKPRFMKFYTFPLEISEFDGQVTTKETDKAGLMMAWDWIKNSYLDIYPLNGRFGEDLAKKIVDRVNGEDVYFDEEYVFTVDKEDPIIIRINNEPCICIRGWGSLTGNPYRLSSTTAAYIQDEFRDFIIQRLNKKI